MQFFPSPVGSSVTFDLPPPRSIECSPRLTEAMDAEDVAAGEPALSPSTGRAVNYSFERMQHMVDAGIVPGARLEVLGVEWRGSSILVKVQMPPFPEHRGLAAMWVFRVQDIEWRTRTPS